MSNHEMLNYVEFPSNDLHKSKVFFENVFAWSFTDYGPRYSAFNGAGMDGGMYDSSKSISGAENSALLVFYSNDIHATQAKIIQAGGEVTRTIFDFPGGCRFHFKEPGGNEFAVWSEHQ